MSLDARIAALRRAAALRQVLIRSACVGPPACASVVLASRVAGGTAAAAIAVVAAAAFALDAGRTLRRVDRVWTARRLDACEPALDDSSDLLLRDPHALSPLQRLQRTRVSARLDALRADIRPAWPWRTLAFAAAGALLLLGFAAIAPRHEPGDPDVRSIARNRARTDATRIVASELAIEAPAYTKIALRRETSLDAKVVENSVLRWRLRFDPRPTAATLLFHDDSRVALVRDGDTWTGSRTLPTSALYRIVLEGAPAPADARLYRIDVVADRAPEIRVIAPDKSLTLRDAGQKTWDLVFEAGDDYAIAHADLTITRAQGSGENIAFKEQTLALGGEPVAAADPSRTADLPAEPAPDRARQPALARFSHTLDLAALGIAEGDDVIVRLAVSDNREPQPNVSRSASFILRWPAAASAGSADLEGIVQRILPAYFRSQRQIIIDTEAVVAERPHLEAASVLKRSDALGVDQKILRLRYGQFLGEESETRAETAAAGDTNAATQIDALAAAHAARERRMPQSGPTRFGTEGDTVAEYGHVHDIAEAATLLDPATRSILKSALDEMWQAELHLRQGAPEQALPFEHRALDLIKQVQQSTRIYLARVGLELPIADEARRLSGERKDLGDRVASLAKADVAPTPLVVLWRVLAGAGTPDWASAQAWIVAHQASLSDPLGLLAAIDAARRDPNCTTCRAALRDRLWPLLPMPTAQAQPRQRTDAAGRAYLDALRTSAAGFSR